MSEKFSYEEWKRTSTNLTKTKENIEEMSKLYIVAHEKVKLIIRKCQSDLTYNPLADCERQLNFIKTILERLANRQQDEYLSLIDPKMLDRYEKNFFDLIELLTLALGTYDNRDKLNFEGLKSISEKKFLKTGEFSLRSEIQKSQTRLIRTKSGHRITKKVRNSEKESNNQQFYNQIKQNDNIQIIEPEKHEEEFKERKAKLEATINSQFQKQGFSLSFKKKYQKLEQYLQERKQFSDLLFSQNYYDHMIDITKARKNEPKVQEKKDPDLNKIFPEFNIQTKYMKSQVKQNILKVIFDVKKQLLKQYHESNVVKMRDANEAGMMKIDNENKKVRKISSGESEITCLSKTERRFRSTNKLIEKSEKDRRRVSLVSFNREKKKVPQWLDDEGIRILEKKAQDMFQNNKMPIYKR